MCQIEIYNFMRDLRATGDNNYYTAMEIHKLMKTAGREISERRFHEKLTRLWWFKFIEKKEGLNNKIRGNPYSRRQFRAKTNHTTTLKE